ncbi:MAG: insulinase family protein [Bacteroidales bacterium]|nr:insulinase family protein [Candidatus Scybalocola fimicaballi]
MSMLDRSVCPPIHDIKSIVVPEIETINLKNGSRLHCMKSGIDEVVRVTVIVGVGLDVQKVPLSIRMMSSLLFEGTKDMTQAEVAEKFDFYGARKAGTPGMYACSYDLICLSKHLPKIIDVFVDSVFTPAFREVDFRRLSKIMKTNMKDMFKRVDYLSDKNLDYMLFGENARMIHPELEDFDNLKVDDLKKLHSGHFNIENVEIVACGMIDDEVKKVLVDTFSNIAPSGKTRKKDNPLVLPTLDKKYNFLHQKGVQAGVCIGRQLFGRTNSDERGMRFLNTVLGGYFGSRLSSNIREDKGYTYGIYSDASINKHHGTLTISTQCDNKYVQNVIDETFKEMEILCNEKMSDDELERVKNYLLGTMCTTYGNPIGWNNEMIHAVTSANGGEVSLARINNYIDYIRSASADDVKAMAQKYFAKDDFCVSVVADKDKIK